MRTELRTMSTRRDNIPSPNPEAVGCVERFATFMSLLLVIITFPFSLFECFKVVQEFERAVIFRLGRVRKGGARGPGLFFVLPCIDTYRKVDLRTVSFDVPPQEVLTRDSVTVAVDAVVYYRIKEPLNAVVRVADYSASTRLLAATTLRNVLGMRDLAQLLSDREAISHMMQSNLDEATDPWGVEVERVEIKDVRLPVQLQRAMAAEAEADREARAKIIAAQGEIKASKALKEASLVMIDNPMALQVVHEFQRAVMFRLGRLMEGPAKGPGVVCYIPCIDTCRIVDLRTVSFDVPPQEVLTKDSVTVQVDAVVYYKVREPVDAIVKIKDYCGSTQFLAQTTLRNELGKRDLAQLLSDREAISHTMQITLDLATDPWGIEVERVEIKDVRLPFQLQKAMAAEAEAMREARAKIIVAEGEIKASKALREASKIMVDNPVALQLRYLQTLNNISTSSASNSTVVFPFPMEFLHTLLGNSR